MTAGFLVVLDIDSTLINEEGLDELAGSLGPEVAREVERITDQAMAGQLDFAQSLRRRVALLRGVSADTLPTVSARLTLTDGASELVESIHREGGRVVAVSGGFHELVDNLARNLGLDDWRANRLEVTDGLLTGGLAGPIVDAQAKADFLQEMASRWGISPQHTVAVGDGANDVEMFRVAGTSVAFCGKPIAIQHATVSINERDLRLVLPAIGRIEASAPSPNPRPRG